MRKESYQRSQSKLQGEVDGLKSHISKQDEQRARGLDGVIHEIRTKHEKIQEKIYVMKDQTSQILQERGERLLLTRLLLQVLRASLARRGPRSTPPARS